jgi:hypothetical protein
LKLKKINNQVWRFIMALALAGGMAILFSACAGPKKVAFKTVYFPPPPDEPRLQYLTSIKDSIFWWKKVLSG